MALLVVLLSSTFTRFLTCAQSSRNEYVQAVVPAMHRVQTCMGLSSMHLLSFLVTSNSLIHACPSRTEQHCLSGDVTLCVAGHTQR